MPKQNESLEASEDQIKFPQTFHFESQQCMCMQMRPTVSLKKAFHPMEKAACFTKDSPEKPYDLY